MTDQIRRHVSHLGAVFSCNPARVIELPQVVGRDTLPAAPRGRQHEARLLSSFAEHNHRVHIMHRADQFDALQSGIASE